MAHELSIAADGRASMAFVGQTPWHGLGQELQPGADLLTWQQEAGLDWEAKTAVVSYDREITDFDGSTKKLLTAKSDSRVLYRNDTGAALSVVSDRYRPVQPKQIIEFYRDLTEKHGFVLETAGALKGGRKIWALARTGHRATLPGGDALLGYLLLATSYDGSMSTQGRWTGVRVVCNNTIEVATQGRAEVVVPHSTTFDADKVKVELQIGDAWERFEAQSHAMARREVSQDESVKFFMEAYFNLTTPEQIHEARKDEKVAASMDKTMERLRDNLFQSPGSHMASARGMLWGLVNAVTFDVDHVKPARSQENRLDAAWFGQGAALKQRA
jgi:phage/plasmid-like protein (TIGR03299 family)